MKSNHHSRHSRRTVAEAQLRLEAVVEMREAISPDVNLALRDGAVQAVSAEARLEGGGSPVYTGLGVHALDARSGEVSAVSPAHKSPPLSTCQFELSNSEQRNGDGRSLLVKPINSLLQALCSGLDYFAPEQLSSPDRNMPRKSTLNNRAQSNFA